MFWCKSYCLDMWATRLEGYVSMVVFDLWHFFEGSAVIQNLDAFKQLVGKVLITVV